MPDASDSSSLALNIFSKSGCDLLTVSNWDAWERRITAVLRSLRLLAIVQKGRKSDSDEKELDRDARAKDILMFSVSECYTDLIDQASSAKEAYELLRDRAQSSAATNVMAVVSEFLEMRMEPSVELEDYFFRIRTYSSTLKNC